MSRSTAGHAFVVVVFVCSLLFTLVQPLWSSVDAPAQAFVAALRVHQALVVPGDIVLVHPPWRDDVVMAIRAAGLVPDDIVVTEAFAPRHGEAWPRLVVVADASWPLPAAFRGRLAFAGDHDSGVSVLTTIDSLSPTAFDIARATVTVTGGGEAEVQCRWNSQRRRHVCPGLPPWASVGPDTVLIEQREQACVWAHPMTDRTLVVDYGVVHVDNSVTLSLALTDAAAANPDGAAVMARLLVGDHEGRVSAHHHQGFSTTRIEHTGAATLRVELTTRNDGQRHTCFRLERGP